MFLEVNFSIISIVMLAMRLRYESPILQAHFPGLPIHLTQHS